MNAKEKPKKQMKEDIFAHHGISLAEYIANPNIPIWIKVLTYILKWYLMPQHKNLVFFQKYSTIRRFFKKCGFSCSEESIEEAFRILKKDEKHGGVGFISVVYNEMTKQDWILKGNNPNKYIYRKVYLNWKRIYKYFSIFSTEGYLFKSLKAKSRLKKLVQCRALSYTKELQSQFEHAMMENRIEIYTTATKMFYGYLYTVSRKYYDPSRLIKNTIPEHAINLQKAQDAELWIDIVSNQLRGSPSDPLRTIAANSLQAQSKQAPTCLKEFYDKI